jgi:WD40 repeat protein
LKGKSGVILAKDKERVMSKRFAIVLLLLCGVFFNVAAQNVEVYPQLGHESGVRLNTVAFSPDGKQIITGSNDRTIKLWDVATGREIRTFFGHTDGVESVVFSPDGRQILSSGDKTIKLWDVATGREIRTFSGHSSSVFSIEFSPDGRQMRSESNDEIKLWDVETGREIRMPRDNIIKLWNNTAVREINYDWVYAGHSISVSCVAISPDGSRIVSVGSTGAFGLEDIKLWDTTTRREIRSFSSKINYVRTMALSPDGRQILSGMNDWTVKLWDSTTGKEVRTFSDYSIWGNTITFSPDGWQVLYSSWDAKEEAAIKSLDILTGREIRNYPGHSFGGGLHSFRGSIIFSPDGRQIITSLGSSSTPLIKLMEVGTGREIRTFSGHSYGAPSLAFSTDGRQILSGSLDTTIKLWDINTGREIRTFTGHSNWVMSIAFSPDNRQVLSCSNDKTIKLWDINTGHEIRTFLGHAGGVNSVVFSPDGKQILSGSDDNTIRLWDTATGRTLRAFTGHSGSVNYAVFSPNGRQIISASTDGTIRIWDTATGREIAQFISFTDGEWIVITPDGYYNASPNGDRYLNVRIGNNVYGIDQFRARFDNPQIVEARLQGRPDPVQVTTTIQNAGNFPPPVVRINSPQDGTEVATGQIELSVTVEDTTQTVREIQVFINGNQISGETMRSSGIRGARGGDLEGANFEPVGINLSGSQNRVDFIMNLNLVSGTNRIMVVAKNAYQSEGRASITITNRQAVQNALPNLWILSIGVNRYTSPQLGTLNYCVNDAKEIINAFKAQEGRVYGRVNSLLIADGERITPTVDNIKNNFSYLRQAGQNDVVLLFIAGHGLSNEAGTFFFLPSDAAFNADGTIRPSTAVSHFELQEVLTAPGRKLVFIDACRSGSAITGRTRMVDNTLLVRRLNNQSTVILTASTGSQDSQERPDLRHGVFTYALIQGLRGEAILAGKTTVTIDTLKAYVTDRVRELTEGQQRPMGSSTEGYEDLELARRR